jgi:hypothetical protein
MTIVTGKAKSFAFLQSTCRPNDMASGNPPFSSVGACRGGLRNPVVEFINHVSTLADKIIFIVPPTMNRPTCRIGYSLICTLLWATPFIRLCQTLERRLREL